MYFLLVQPHQKRFARQEKAYRAQLQKYDLIGEWQRALEPKDIPRLLKLAHQEQFKTLVIVGGDDFAQRTLPLLIGSRLSVGFLPLGSDVPLLRHWGVEAGDPEQLVEDLAARRMFSAPVARVGQQVFWQHFRAGWSAEETLLKEKAARGLRQKFGAWRDKRRLQQQVLLDKVQLTADDLTLTGSGHELEIEFRPFQEIGTRLQLRFWEGSPQVKQSGESGMTQLQAEKISLRFPAKQAALLDGDRFDLRQADITIEEDALQLIVGRRALQPF